MTNTHQDALLSGLLEVGKHYGVAINPEQVTHGLPLKDGKLTPDLFTQCASRAGLTAHISSRKLTKIHPSLLPVVIPLKGGLVFVMTRWETRKQIQGKVIAEGTVNEIEFSLKELNSRYLGYIFLVRNEDTDDREDLITSVAKKRAHWFWSTLWQFRSVYTKVAVATLCINFMGLASSIFIMNVYDRVVPNEATDTLYALAIGVLIAYTMEFFLKMLRTVFVDLAGRRIDVILGGEVFGKVLATKFQFKPAAAGTLAAQARSYETVREFFTSATISTLIDLPFILLFVAIVFLLGHTAAVPLIVGVILALIWSMVLQIPINRAVGKSYQTSNQRYALMVESVNSLETVKATSSESELQARMENCVRDSAKAEGQSRGFTQLGANSLAMIAHLVSTFTVIFAYFRVTANEMSMGAMIACVLLCGRAMAPLNSFAALMMRLQQSMRSLKSLNEMMKQEDERDRRDKISVHSFKPRIEASNLKFGFGENPEEILKNLNFTIKPGERVALVGKIGCGKTTLMRLLMALYEPREGSITVSGLDTRQWSSPALRKHFGYLPQDPSLLYGTLGSNLMSGCKGKISEANLIQAVEMAGLSDFVANLPEGLSTPVSEGGKSLSGGQRQSIFLARALLRSPEILLLDEPTSSMDQLTEKTVLRNLDEYMKADPNRTMIISTHRQSILSIVDRIIVLDKGRIVSDGPKTKVVAKKDMQLKQNTSPVNVRPTSNQSVELPS
ncbi:MAG: type I secretion system permease/ATPase [Verrucomicrobiales bacterium]|nr:type I secretion system permease/ATPase [Verrucomicrobiales bacterium]